MAMKERRPAPDDGAIRIQRYLSRAGAASRREAEEMILEGRVRVNHETVLELGTKVVPGRDRVELDGRVIRESAARWVLLHKPAGTLTTRSDPRGRPTVFGLLPRELGGLRYVGRLDWNTEGLLLLTSEGEMLHQLTHPSSQLEREYEAWVRGVPGAATLRLLRQGVELEDGPARAAQARVLGRTGEGAVVSLVLLEGRKREVRRLLEAVGHAVLRLRRVRFGPVGLGDLKVGEWRDLTANEIRALSEAARGRRGT